MKYLKSISFWRRVSIVVLLVLILIRPTISTDSSKRSSSNLNIWFVVDATNSMVAKDVENGNTRRYEKVQSDLATIVNNVPGARYGLIIQDYATSVVVPSTSDANAVIAAKSYVAPKSTINSRPTALKELLDYAGETISGVKTAHPERTNALVFMSDGEDTSNVDYTSQPELKNLVDSSVVFGYGSTEGATVENVRTVSSISANNGEIIDEDYKLYYDNNFEQYGLIKDDKGHVLSRINEQSLNSLASSLSGKYYHRENGDVPSEAINTIKNTATNLTSSDSSASTKGQLYWLFAILLLAILLWEGEEFIVNLLLEKENKNA